MFHAESDCCQKVYGHKKEYEIFQFAAAMVRSFQGDGPYLGQPRVSTPKISHAIGNIADAVGRGAYLAPSPCHG